MSEESEGAAAAAAADSAAPAAPAAMEADDFEPTYFPGEVVCCSILIT